MYDIERQNIIFPHFLEGMFRNTVGTDCDEVLDSGQRLAHSAATRPACEWFA